MCYLVRLLLIILAELIDLLISTIVLHIALAYHQSEQKGY